MEKENEEWKDIKDYEGLYQVSNLGNVKSLNYNKTGKEKILKSRKTKDNYLRVNLYKHGKLKTCLVHRLVAETFIPKIVGKDYVDHIDSNRQNNVYTNIRWCTVSENNNFDLCKKHRSEAKQGEKNHMYGKHHTKESKRKISESHKGEKHYMYGKTGELNHRSKPILCVELNKIFGSTREAERELGIEHSSISKCCKGKVKYAGKHPLTGEGLHWKYMEENNGDSRNNSSIRGFKENVRSANNTTSKCK